MSRRVAEHRELTHERRTVDYHRTNGLRVREVKLAVDQSWSGSARGLIGGENVSLECVSGVGCLLTCHDLARQAVELGDD